MPRLFTGLEIPPDVAFALSLKKGGLPGARWIDKDNYHITLRYVGEVDNRTAAEIVEALDRFTGFESFVLRLDHLGSFGGNKPRALFAGAEPSAALARLHASQERALQQIGLPPDSRKFSPHVTLARLKTTTPGDLARYLEETPRFVPLSFSVARFVLFSSRESMGGGPYLVEESYDLAA
ncbi:MAG: RNA 2',3'-cyclic phosphodiesterase [Alphaproteobacteria bacterium]|nr:RNA 2',3'-cyclic phosphodiesterase [Alphaproteobacteria bacterium]